MCQCPGNKNSNSADVLDSIKNISKFAEKMLFFFLNIVELKRKKVMLIVLLLFTV